MACYSAEVSEIARFHAASCERREAIGRETAAALGDGWSTAGLVGAKKLCAVRYAPLDLVFVVVPGGRFEMGFREDDRAAVGQVMDLADPFVVEFLEACEKDARPLREVAVRPFLLTQQFLGDEQLERIEPEYPASSVGFEAARRLSAAAGFRLPSEAEYEWVAREGGALHFTGDASAQFTEKPLGASYLMSGFGIEGLASPHWLEDDPHLDYVGAPATSEPWMNPTKRPPTLEEGHQDDNGVRRGMLEDLIRRPVDLLYTLASLRGGGDTVELRLCRDLG